MSNTFKNPNCVTNFVLNKTNMIWPVKPAVNDNSKKFTTFNHIKTITIWRQCDTLCTSGFVDEVMFSHNRTNGPNQREHLCLSAPGGAYLFYILLDPGQAHRLTEGPCFQDALPVAFLTRKNGGCVGANINGGKDSMCMYCAVYCS